jgi:hypothetical protein
MSKETLLRELALVGLAARRAELDELELALQATTQVTSPSEPRAVANDRGRRRGLSDAQRKAQSRRMKAIWAEKRAQQPA